MGYIVKQCEKCKQIIGCCNENDTIHTANGCNGRLLELKITYDELCVIEDISSDDSFLEAMIDLKEKDPIEFQLKMNQFKTNLGQQESIKMQTDTRPKCPTCGSTNLKKVSTTSKVTSVAMWGLFSQKIKKTWHCNNCKYEW